MNEIKPENFEHVLALKSEPESVYKARKFVEWLFRNHSIKKDFIFNMGLAVSEAVANAVSHGSNSAANKIILSMQIKKNVLQILVEDFQGKVFDPEYFRRIAMVKDWGKGGRGIMMMDLLMDNLSYLIEEGKHTILFMEKALPDEPEAKEQESKD